ncbi:MAG: cadherin-like domain-containing protein, partial [Planctomycetales bacterium]|nr:cadherin-like domain-containing protein [Planctomycetales bacterium]
FGVGAYSLTITADSLLGIGTNQVNRAARTRLRHISTDALDAMLSPEGEKLFNDDNHSNEEAGEATELQAEDDGAQAVRFLQVASLSDLSDIDYYRVSTPRATTGDTVTVQVELDSLDIGGLIPQLQAFDNDNHPLPTRIIVNGNGRLVAQIQNVEADSELTLRVSAAHTLAFDGGNYQLQVSFPTAAIELSQFVAGELAEGVQRAAHELTVATPQLFNFLFTAGTVNPPPSSSPAGVMLRIIDDTGLIAYEVASRAGESRSAASVLLNPGVYVIEAIRLELPGAPPAGTLSYALHGIVTSDPFAIDPANPSDLEYNCPDLEGMFCYPGGVVSDNPYLWILFLSNWTQSNPVTGGSLYQALMADWWGWYWGQMDEIGPPLALDDEYVADEQGRLVVAASLGLLANDFDPQAEPMVAAILTLPSHGSLIAEPDGSFRYQAVNGFRGTDTFNYQATDFFGDSAPATVSVTVNGPATIPGDFNADAEVNVVDIDLLSAALQASSTAIEFDVNDDQLVDTSDWDYLIENILQTSLGDANLDGIFDSSDLILVFQHGLYESSDTQATWSSGDWNADGQFDTRDIIAAFQTGRYV